MAPSVMIKCKTEVGTYTLSELTMDSTVWDLKNNVYKLTQIKPEAMKILCGYPPKPIGVDKNKSTLPEVSISSGDTIIIETLKYPVVAEANFSEAAEAKFSETAETKFSEATETKFSEAAEAKFSEAAGAKFSEAAGAKFSEATGTKFPEVAEAVVSSTHSGEGDCNLPEWSKAKELENIMLSQGGILMRHVVPSDNSCLFNSVYFIISNGELNAEKSHEMRKIIANAVRSNPVKYNAAFLGMENHEYCSWILDDNHWGGGIELAILSEHFKVEIVAVDTITLNMHRFGETDNHPQRIFLIYDGIHYDPLILELEDSRQGVFSVAETSVLEMALEIAKEAKSSRQFTDVANFTLACQVCNARLKGEKEATEHAKVTGHANFGEL